MAARDAILVAGGLGIGFLIGRILLPPRSSGAARAPSNAPPLARIADDALYACEQLRPTLVEIRDAARDGRITVGEYVGISQQVQGLTRKRNPGAAKGYSATGGEVRRNTLPHPRSWRTVQHQLVPTEFHGRTYPAQVLTVTTRDGAQYTFNALRDAVPGRPEVAVRPWMRKPGPISVPRRDWKVLYRVVGDLFRPVDSGVSRRVSNPPYVLARLK